MRTVTEPRPAASRLDLPGAMSGSWKRARTVHRPRTEHDNGRQSCLRPTLRSWLRYGVLPWFTRTEMVKKRARGRGVRKAAYRVEPSEHAGYKDQEGPAWHSERFWHWVIQRAPGQRPRLAAIGSGPRTRFQTHAYSYPHGCAIPTIVFCDKCNSNRLFVLLAPSVIPVSC